MRILGIETSCDETAVAIIEDGTKIIASNVASSKELHEKTGGIIPEAAAREQVKCIIPVINETLKQSNRSKFHQKNNTSIAQLLNYLITEINAIAVTIGPGLISSLLVGIETSKTISLITKKPIIPVNHIFAHLYANWLYGVIPKFPAIVLIVSGGHSELFFMKGHGQLKWLGGTRDDAAGEAFDKTARLLGLGYPGGPAIAAEAAKIQNPKSKIQNKNKVMKNIYAAKTHRGCVHLRSQAKFKINLPRPMIGDDNLDFSFSGLKTAVMREIKNLKQKYYNTIYYCSEKHAFNLSSSLKGLFAHEIQEAITDVLVEKTLRAAKQYQVKSILLGGGVAANKRLKEKFKFKISNLKFQIDLLIPPPHLCTDNAAYIASYAYFNYHPVPWQKIQAKPNLEVEV